MNDGQAGNDAPDAVVEPDEGWLAQLAIDENEDIIIGVEDDRFSFEDSERFEEDSLCSLQSETGSLNHKWRGWAGKNSNSISAGMLHAADVPGPSTSIYSSELKNPSNIKPTLREINKPTVAAQPANNVKGLATLSAAKVAKSMSFEAIESIYQSIKPREHLPESLMLPILRHCFPESEEDIRLYSCLANGNPDQFTEGEHLYQVGAVGEIFQIGYHLSATVNVYDEISMSESNYQGYMECQTRDSKLPYDVSIRVDRCRLVSCTCSCSDSSSWCQHIVAVCLQRIHNLECVEFRPTIWDSITELSDDKLKKLAQYLINELPREYLPVAQKLIDQLRNSSSEINCIVGAPDPTAGGHDDSAICDVQYLSSSSPQASNEWNTLIRPLRSKEPEALWNLLSIVREMFKRGDENATTLLHVITEDCMCIDQILIWWYQTSLTSSGLWHFTGYRNHTLHSHVSTTQYNAASLCNEIVALWRLAALNPKLSPFEKEQLASLFQLYHRTAVRRIWRINIEDGKGAHLGPKNATFTEKHFPGFFPALQACYLDWSESEICRLMEKLNLAHIQLVIQREGVTPTHNKSAHGFGNCPNIPLLRDGSVVLLSEVLDTEQQQTVTTAACGNVGGIGPPFVSGTISNPKSRKGKRKGPKSNRQSRRNCGSASQKPSTSRSAPLPPVGENVDETDNGSTTAAEDAYEIKGTEQNPKRRERYVDEVEELFASAHSDQNTFSIRFACCESLLGHGYAQETLILAKQLTCELLHNLPNILPTHAPDGKYMDDDNETKTARTAQTKQSCRHYKHTSNCDSCKSIGNIPGGKHSTPHPRVLQASELVATTLSRAILLVKILTTTNCKSVNSVELAGNTEKLLALELALAVMRNPRGPAATRSLEVYTHYLEYELFGLLQKIEIGPAELRLVREVAKSYIFSLRQNPPSRVIVPPTTMSHYIMNALSYSYQMGDVSSNATSSRSRNNTGCPSPVSSPEVTSMRRPEDDNLALEVCLEVLGMRVFVSETDHPMLCEGIRRQRGDLAMVLLLRNRDNPARLGVILDKILDPTVHRMYGDKHSSNAKFFLSDTKSQPERNSKNNIQQNERTETNETESEPTTSISVIGGSVEDPNKPSLNISGAVMRSLPEFLQRRGTQDSFSSAGNTAEESREDSQDGDSPRLSESSGASSSGLSQERGFEFSNKRGNDNERMTTDNSFTIEAFWESQRGHHNHSLPVAGYQFLSNQASEAQAHFMVEFSKRLLTEAGGGNQNNTMFHNNGNGGGVNQGGGPHRHLHICSFITGLYALGLNNQVSSTWLTRTYSTHVSWIQTQTLEIGRSALEIVRQTWEAHLAPTEVASLADKASLSSDASVVDEAARLALSVLPKAYALTVTQSTRALEQCKEHSARLLQEACLSVEKAAEKDGVYPEVLFKVAKHWYNLHLETNKSYSTHNNSSRLHASHSAPNLQPMLASAQPPVSIGVQPQALPTQGYWSQGQNIGQLVMMPYGTSTQHTAPTMTMPYEIKNIYSKLSHIINAIERKTENYLRLFNRKDSVRVMPHLYFSTQKKELKTFVLICAFWCTQI
ncbi:zinc finger SWIM domain-containing protein 4 [Ditylenchus destructor]|uniref:Zinc finger SWIM domain-containing protein 4 n=1 Tax=Ditylenchus destructor TaxID=166010 RepID=A0AAD4NFD4_9BILA|nr:zinc finger SWIM domain-containing protein 4 [Ditylenchus destructor]